MNRLTASLCPPRQQRGQRAAQIIVELEKALAEFDDERNWQDLLNRFPEVIGWRFGWGSSPTIIRPQLRLGSEFVADFVVIDSPQWTAVTLVEIEPPSSRPFNKSGTYSKGLAKAVKQTTEWKQWVRENHAYFHDKLMSVVREVYPYHSEYIDYIRRRLEGGYMFQIQTGIVIGRREHYDNRKDSRSRIGFLNSTDEAALFSYDALLDTCRDRFK